tara:strand:- start:3029 stop:3373 length:345 start_codon:yes stop_codon:yes gene_type:complete
MDDAATGGHPLHTTIAQVAPVSEMIFMQHVPLDHIGHGFEPPMGVRGEACDIVGGLGGTKLVQHQERVKANVLLLANGTLDAHAGTVGRFQGGYDLFQGAQGHDVLLSLALGSI